MKFNNCLNLTKLSAGDFVSLKGHSRLWKQLPAPSSSLRAINGNTPGGEMSMGKLKKLKYAFIFICRPCDISKFVFPQSEHNTHRILLL